MAAVGDEALLGARRGAVLLAIGITLAAVGHAAWWIELDTSPRPFLPEDAAEAKAEVTRAFPNATPPTVRVLLVAEDGTNVLSPDALTALAGLQNRISSDPAVAPVLARGAPLASALTALEPHLEGRPGEWDQATVDDALEAATATAEQRRTLAGFLDTDARIDGEETTATMTVLAVRLAPTSTPDEVTLAEDRIDTLAQGISVADVDVATDATSLRQDAARSPRGLWVAIGTLVLVPLAALAAGAPLRRVPAWLAALAAGAGAGLTAGVLAGHATPASLGTAHLAAGSGLALVAMHDATAPEGLPGWTRLLPIAPLAVLAAWTPAGLGALATVATVAALVPLITRHIHPGALTATPRWRPPILDTEAPWRRLPRLTGPALVTLIVAAAVAVAGLPASADAGWHGSLPDGTQAGQAAAALERGFGGTGPGSQLAIAAWGPVEEPGFLGAVQETADRLDRLTLAATGGNVETILAVGEDWASDDTASDPSDDHDPSFAAAWRNATDERGVPVRNVTALFDRLGELDPDATRAHLIQPGATRAGATLVRQQVSVSDVVPRPAATVEAALQPLLAASDRIAEGGNALDDARAEAALADAIRPATLIAVVASLGAGALYLGRARGRVGLGALAGALASAPILVALTGLPGVGLAVRPGTLLACATAGALTLGLVLPATARALDEDDDPRTGRWLAGATLPGLALVLAVLLPLASAPAPALQAAGLTLGLGVLASLIVIPAALPALVREAGSASRDGRSVLEDDDRLPAQAHTVCPVCERSTATAAERCTGCGRWNLLEACPAHPDALASRCAECGRRLSEPRFR